VCIAGGFEGGVEVDCVFFVEVGRCEVGASPCELSGAQGYVGVNVWVSGVDDEAGSSCVEEEEWV
jgi:hypothetical protein